MTAQSRRPGPVASLAAATVFAMVLTRGPISRVEIARRTGLSSAAVTKAARPFIDAGYLEETGVAEHTGPGAGRPASPLDVRPDREFFAGVKITGDELIGVVTDLRAQVRDSLHRPLPGTSVQTVLAELAELVTQLLARDPAYGSHCHTLGLSIAGDVDRANGVVRYSPFLGWREVALAELAHAATGLAVTVENDVNALAAAEQWFGEGIGLSSFAVVTIGVGIGCGLVVNGSVVTGEHGVAGELGHVPIGGEGRPCHCGGRGCVEATAGTAALLASARTATGRPELTIEGAIEAAHQGDQRVAAVFARAAHAIGLAMAAMANLFGPARIIVTGDEAGLAAYLPLEDLLRRAFAGQAFGAAAECEVVLRARPFEQWARGAAAVAIRTLFTLRKGTPRGL